MKKAINWEKPRIGTMTCGRLSNAENSTGMRSAHYDIGPAPTPTPSPSRPIANYNWGPAPTPVPPSRPETRQTIGPAPSPSRLYHLGPAPSPFKQI